MKAYKMEVWVTLICFILVGLIGGFASLFFVIFNEMFFEQVAVPEHLAHVFESFFVVKQTVMGFPLHFFLLITLSWIGATLIGVIWSLVIDRLEKTQRI